MNEDKLNLLSHEEYDKDFDELTEFQKTDIEAKVADEHKGDRKGHTKDWDMISLEDICFKLDQKGIDAWSDDPDEVYDKAEANGLTPEQFSRVGSAQKEYAGDTFEEKMSRGRNTSGSYANVVAKIGAHKRAITGESRQGSRKGFGENEQKWLDAKNKLIYTIKDNVGKSGNWNGYDYSTKLKEFPNEVELEVLDNSDYEGSLVASISSPSTDVFDVFANGNNYRFDTNDEYSQIAIDLCLQDIKDACSDSNLHYVLANG